MLYFNASDKSRIYVMQLYDNTICKYAKFLYISIKFYKSVLCVMSTKRH